MKDRFRIAALCFCAALAAGLAGCTSRAAPKAAPPEPTVVPVSKPVARTVTDYMDFTGRTAAVQSVDIRPRVTGYLVKIPFKEGAMVKAGDLLFVVDRRPYQAQLDQARGRSTSTRPSSSWPGSPWPATGPSPACRRAPSASSSSTRTRP